MVNYKSIRNTRCSGRAAVNSESLRASRSLHLALIALLLALSSVLLAPGSLAQAQQSTKVPRIGYLGVVASLAWHEAFRQGLRDLGYVEGKNIVIEYRWVENRAVPCHRGRAGESKGRHHRCDRFGNCARSQGGDRHNSHCH